MSAPSAGSAHALARIAAVLGLPVEAFTHSGPASTADLIGQFAAAPEGLRLAAAFLALPPGLRAALANGAESLATTAASAASVPEASAQ